MAEMTSTSPPSVEEVLEDVKTVLDFRAQVQQQIRANTASLCSDKPVKSGTQPHPKDEMVDVPYSLLHSLLCERKAMIGGINELRSLLHLIDALRAESSRSTSPRYNASLTVGGDPHSTGSGFHLFKTPRDLRRRGEKKELDKREKKKKKQHQSGGEYLQNRILSKEVDASLLPDDMPLLEEFFNHCQNLGNFPAIRTRELTSERPLTTLKGPGESSLEYETFKNIACGRVESSYPLLRGRPTREGDPICDCYCIKLYDDCQVVCLTDGCSWGDKARKAARAANSAFMQYMQKSLKQLDNLTNICVYLLCALVTAHHRIISGYDDVWEAGTTTLAGGVLLRVKNASDVPLKYLFACVSIGDCKIYHIDGSTAAVTDITKGNRLYLSDPTDPGGRLGPQLNDGEADLRNLAVHYHLCKEKDVITIVSDGVHDNLDPEIHGLIPADVGLSPGTWSSVNQAEVSAAKSNFAEVLISDLVRESLYALSLTSASRTFMEKNPALKLPKDYKRFPGKLDHTSCVSFRVGPSSPMTKEKGQDREKEKEKEKEKDKDKDDKDSQKDKEKESSNDKEKEKEKSNGKQNTSSNSGTITSAIAQHTHDTDKEGTQSKEKEKEKDNRQREKGKENKSQQPSEKEKMLSRKKSLERKILHGTSPLSSPRRKEKDDSERRKGENEKMTIAHRSKSKDRKTAMTDSKTKKDGENSLSKSMSDGDKSSLTTQTKSKEKRNEARTKKDVDDSFRTGGAHRSKK